MKDRGGDNNTVMVAKPRITENNKEKDTETKRTTMRIGANPVVRAAGATPK